MQQHQGAIPGVIHCFSGSQWLAHKALDLGLYISISGIVTFKKSDDLRTIVKGLPLDRLLIETEAPFLAPHPHRGKRNEPVFVRETAQVVADLKGLSLEDLAQISFDNALRLFTRVKS